MIKVIVAHLMILCSREYCLRMASGPSFSKSLLQSACKSRPLFQLKRTQGRLFFVVFFYSSSSMDSPSASSVMSDRLKELSIARVVSDNRGISNSAISSQAFQLPNLTKARANLSSLLRMRSKILLTCIIIHADVTNCINIMLSHDDDL